MSSASPPRPDALSHRNKISTLWRLGRRIERERTATHAGYHNAVLRDLARDTAVSHRNLQYAVTFYRAYPTQPRLPLSWGHYRLLLDRPTAEQRLHYQQRAVNEKLAVHQLATIIAVDQLPQGDTSTSLPRPALTRYLYEAIVDNVVDGDTVDLRIDVGFEILRQGRFRLASINCAELSSTNTDEARAARDFVYTRLLSAKSIAVLTERHKDQHGRYVAHLFYSTTTLPTETCFTQGTHLNAELVETGHAVRVL